MHFSHVMTLRVKLLNKILAQKIKGKKFIACILYGLSNPRMHCNEFSGEKHINSILKDIEFFFKTAFSILTDIRISEYKNLCLLKNPHI